MVTKMTVHRKHYIRDLRDSSTGITPPQSDLCHHMKMEDTLWKVSWYLHEKELFRTMLRLKGQSKLDYQAENGRFLQERFGWFFEEYRWIKAAWPHTEFPVLGHRVLGQCSIGVLWWM